MEQVETSAVLPSSTSSVELAVAPTPNDTLEKGKPTIQQQGQDKKAEKSLQRENKLLKDEIRRLEQRARTIESDLKKANNVKDRLESLCRELQKQNKFIKAESSARLAEASERGKELAVEVQSNLGFMKSINENLEQITSESLTVKKQNQDLALQIESLENHYLQREEVLQSALKETSTEFLQAQKELADIKLAHVEEKKKLFEEMQQLAETLVKSREQIKEGKETEIQLRELLTKYEEKFNSLQDSLKETNKSYEEFSTDMQKVHKRAKGLEEETSKWQKRWEETNQALEKVQKNNAGLKTELMKANENLIKMTDLCRALQNERKKNGIKGDEGSTDTKPEEEKK